MARGINKVIILGNIGKDPEVKYTPAGLCIVNFSVATSESWKDKQTGHMQERTEWHRMVAMGKLAEIIAQYAKGGSKVYCEGKLQTRKWQDQSGKDRYTTEIVVQEFEMLDSKRDAGPATQSNNAPAPQQDYPDDDIPF